MDKCPRTTNLKPRQPSLPSPHTVRCIPVEMRRQPKPINRTGRITEPSPLLYCSLYSYISKMLSPFKVFRLKCISYFFVDVYTSFLFLRSWFDDANSIIPSRLFILGLRVQKSNSVCMKQAVAKSGKDCSFRLHVWKEKRKTITIRKVTKGLSNLNIASVHDMKAYGKWRCSSICF